MAKIININTGEDREIERLPGIECTLCKSDFNMENEGGTSGDLGILPVAFCPFCLSGLIDMVKQLLDIDDEKEEE